MVRNIEFKDIASAHKIWEKHFKHEFEFPDFINGFISSFSVVQDDKLIAIAGVKPILESIVVLDQDSSPRIRHKALYEILEVSEYVGRRNNFDQLHAFIQDPHYLKVMERRGFTKTVGQGVVRNL